MLTASVVAVLPVLVRLSALGLSELPEVSRAYLVAPTLIGRDAALETVRTELDPGDATAMQVNVIITARAADTAD